jgi:hypothetical protein
MKLIKLNQKSVNLIPTDDGYTSADSEPNYFKRVFPSLQEVFEKNIPALTDCDIRVFTDSPSGKYKYIVDVRYPNNTARTFGVNTIEELIDKLKIFINEDVKDA